MEADNESKGKIMKTKKTGKPANSSDLKPQVSPPQSKPPMVGSKEKKPSAEGEEYFKVDSEFASFIGLKSSERVGRKLIQNTFITYAIEHGLIDNVKRTYDFANCPLLSSKLFTSSIQPRELFSYLKKYVISEVA